MSITVTFEHLMAVVIVAFVAINMYYELRFRKKVHRTLSEYERDINKLRTQVAGILDSKCMNEMPQCIAVDTKVLTKEFNNHSTCTVDSDGTKRWRNKEGLYHRINGPAVEANNGAKIWFLHGQLHRTDGSAEECSNGTKQWFLNDKLHREDGPAIEWVNRDKSWYIEGKKLTEEEFNNRSTCTVNSNGDKEWRNKEGKLHRVDGPAIEHVNGSKYWYLNGKCHREDGPAVEYIDGSESWILNGRCHREDGPAREFASGRKEWYIEGKKLTEEEFNNRSTCITDSNGNKEWKNQEGQVHRVDGPAIERVSGYKSWYLNGKYHRIDGPAVELVDGSKYWYLHGERHRTDGPAVEYSDGIKYWWIEGKELTEEEFNNRSTCTTDSDGTKRWKNKDGELHRTDGPAVERLSGYKAWYMNGNKHREDGPAREWHDGSKSWFLNDKLHRVDGPAVENDDGYKAWYVNGKRHREDGPSVEWSDGTKQWHVEGKELPEEEFNNRSTCTTDSYSNKMWRNKDGQYHREDGPAVEYSSGTKKWHVNGQRHRIDGPAVERADGSKEWHLNGKLHRTDGPAIEGSDGSKEWFIEGKELTEEEFNNRSTCTIDSDGIKKWKNKEGQLHREDGPAIEYADGYKAWHLNGKRHRTDGPAVEDVNGYKAWYLYGLRHKEDGPAREWANGSKEWHIDGKKLTEAEFNNRSTCTVDSDGTKRWRNKEGQLHRTDGPAIEWSDGDKDWWVNDQLHREDGPAIECASGTKFWYIEGNELTEEEFNKRQKQA